jgi:hypothetical protein
VATQSVDHDPRVSIRSTVVLAGGLVLGGFVLNALVTSIFHPSGDEDNHPKIFTDYAEEGGWVAIHVAQFICVLIALSGLIVLYGALRSRGEVGGLAQVAAAATVVTAGAWTILQGLDGVALKEAVDTWVDASGAAKADRFSDAETLRWTEWGLQSYFRVSFGLALALFGSAIVISRLVASWLGWLAIGAGLVSAAIGIDVAYSGLESGFQDAASLVLVLAVLVFAIGLVISGRRREPLAAAAG